LRVDDRQPWLGTTPAAATLSAGQSPHQGLEQAFLDPATEPAVDPAPGREASRQIAPRTARPQMPGNRCHHEAHRLSIRPGRRVRPLQEAGHLVEAGLYNYILQTRLMARPMPRGPHLLSFPPGQAELRFAQETDEDARQRPSNRL
jgi:hypothetical protein